VEESAGVCRGKRIVKICKEHTPLGGIPLFMRGDGGSRNWGTWQVAGWRREPSGGGLTTRQQSDSIGFMPFGWQGGEFADDLIIVLKKSENKIRCLLSVFHRSP